MFLIKNETQTIQNVVFGQLKIQNKRKILCFVDDNFLTTIIVDTKSSHYRAICKLLFACVYFCFKCIVFTTWSKNWPTEYLKILDGFSNWCWLDGNLNQSKRSWKSVCQLESELRASIWKLVLYTLVPIV